MILDLDLNNMFQVTNDNSVISDNLDVNNSKAIKLGTDKHFKHQIVWANAIAFLVLHIAAVYGYILILKGGIGIKTVVFTFILGSLSFESITIGAHRLYTHRSFKAKLSLRVALIILQTIAGQNSMWEWVRDHRQHHKYSDTDADPHNANRGLFFSHIGWLMTRKHPRVIEYGKKIDMSDLEADKLVMFQKKHYKKMYLFIGFLLPTLIPLILWEEDISACLYTVWASRLVTTLNFTWLVNSLAHAIGNKPYDRNIKPAESVIVAFFASGEGWHNYHHTFPWDYRSAELGMIFNQSAMFIDILAWLGLAYDLRSASSKMVNSQQSRAGDKTYDERLRTNISYLKKILTLSSKNIESLNINSGDSKSKLR